MVLSSLNNELYNISGIDWKKTQEYGKHIIYLEVETKLCCLHNTTIITASYSNLENTYLLPHLENIEV